MAKAGERIHLSVPKDVRDDIEKRKKHKNNKFNASAFFVLKYKEEFLNEKAIKHKLEFHKKEYDMYAEKLAAIKDSSVKIPEISEARCPTCTMFYNEDISIRNKKHIYKSLYVCAECEVQQKEKLEQLVKEMKSAAEDPNGEEEKGEH